MPMPTPSASCSNRLGVAITKANTSPIITKWCVADHTGAQCHDYLASNMPVAQGCFPHCCRPLQTILLTIARFPPARIVGSARTSFNTADFDKGLRAGQDTHITFAACSERHTHGSLTVGRASTKPPANPVIVDFSRQWRLAAP